MHSVFALLFALCVLAPATAWCAELLLGPHPQAYLSLPLDILQARKVFWGHAGTAVYLWLSVISSTVVQAAWLFCAGYTRVRELLRCGLQLGNLQQHGVGIERTHLLDC